MRAEYCGEEEGRRWRGHGGGGGGSRPGGRLAGGGRIRGARPEKLPQLSLASVGVESGMKRQGRRNTGARAAAALPPSLEARLSEGSEGLGQLGGRRPCSSGTRLQHSALGLIVPGSRRLGPARPAGCTRPCQGRRAGAGAPTGGRWAACACLFKGLGLQGCRAGGVRVAPGVCEGESGGRLPEGGREGASRRASQPASDAGRPCRRRDRTRGLLPSGPLPRLGLPRGGG